jgi:signal transduction histidine kinase
VPAGFDFSISPEWWQTWWFRSLGLAALVAAVTCAVRARMKRMIWEQRKLEKAVGERTAVIERQKHEIEQLLQQTQEVSRLKSEFLATMSHEIRTPMNGVIGMTQLVLETPLDAEQKEYVQTIQTSADSLLVVINDILDFSKIEAGRMELSHQPFHLRECVNKALQVFTWKAKEKRLDLQSEVSPEVPDVVVGDADRLRQVLLNLIGNAMKFTERGRILLAVSASDEVPVTPGETMLRFSVADTGIGIPNDKQRDVFDAFVQADGSAKRRYSGTGLGLAICSKLVQLMGGRIWVESTPGSGSTFYFTALLKPLTPNAAWPEPNRSRSFQPSEGAKKLTADERG